MIATHAPHLSSNVPAEGMLRLLSGASSGGRATVTWLRQTLCSLTGHAMLLHFESSRLSLQCTSCGHTTPGWAIEESRGR